MHPTDGGEVVQINRLLSLLLFWCHYPVKAELQVGIKLNENFLTAVMLNFTIRCGPLSWGKRCVPAWGTSAICWPVSPAFSLKEVKSVLALWV